MRLRTAWRTLGGVGTATAGLAAAITALRYEDLPPRIVTIARQCLLDVLGTTIAGSRAPAGKAASNGVLAADLAAAGFTSQAAAVAQAVHGLDGAGNVRALCELLRADM
jgi:2-methylcitrate dehydratase PrpD